MSVLRLFYRLTEKLRKPPVEANLQSIRESHAKRRKASASGAGATDHAAAPPPSARPDEPIEEVLRRDWEILCALSVPRSPHVSEEELEMLLAGSDLPLHCQEHYAECNLCHDLLRRAHRADEQVDSVARALATTPLHRQPSPPSP